MDRRYGPQSRALASWVIGLIDGVEWSARRTTDSVMPKSKWLRRWLSEFKGQVTPIFNLLFIRTAIPVHDVGTGYRNESCSIWNKLTKININSWGKAGEKSKINEPPTWIDAALSFPMSPLVDLFIIEQLSVLKLVPTQCSGIRERRKGNFKMGVSCPLTLNS